MLELLVVVVIIGVLAAIAIPSVMTTLRAYQVTSAADGKQRHEEWPDEAGHAAWPRPLPQSQSVTNEFRR
jgi:Tfp pilus assembly protein PilE